MPPRRKSARTEPATELELVADSDAMLAINFRLHCVRRHPLLRFRSRGEHNADHRLHQEHLDHNHPNTRPEVPETEEREGENA